MLRRAFLRSGVTSGLFVSVSLGGTFFPTNAQGQTDTRFAEAVLHPRYLPCSGMLEIFLLQAIEQLNFREISEAEAEVTDASDAAAYFHRAASRLTLLGSRYVYQANLSVGEREKEIRQREQENHQILLAAIDDYTRGLQLDPTAIEARSERSLVYWRLEEKDKALADCEIFLQSSGDNFAMRVMRIMHRLQTDDSEGALADCDYVLAHPPTDSLGLMYLPIIYEARGESQDLLGREGAAIADYTAALNFPGAQEGLAYSIRLNRGSVYYGLGSYDQAIKDFDWMTRSQPEMAFYNRALCYLKLNRLKEAMRDFNLAILWDGEPEYADGTYYIGRGLVFHLLGNETKARRDYLQAVKLYKIWIAKYGGDEGGRHRMKLGLAYAALGETEMARKTLLQAKEEASAQKDTYLVLSIEKYLKLLAS